jgi:hypothetical protein
VPPSPRHCPFSSSKTLKCELPVAAPETAVVGAAAEPAAVAVPGTAVAAAVVLPVAVPETVAVAAPETAAGVVAVVAPETRVADPDPDWIRIQSGQWIRIQEGKNDQQK